MSDLTTDVGGVEEQALKCPECNDTWLHQSGVEVFVRDSEDADKGIHASVEYGDGVSVDRSMDGNPSRRRDGIQIKFWCEQCHDGESDPYVLRIEQHKGEEFVSWE